MNCTDAASDIVTLKISGWSKITSVLKFIGAREIGWMAIYRYYNIKLYFNILTQIEHFKSYAFNQRYCQTLYII